MGAARITPILWTRCGSLIWEIDEGVLVVNALAVADLCCCAAVLSK